MFSASSEARDRNAPTNANKIRLQTSRIRQEHRPIRYQLPAGLSFRQGQGGFRRFYGVIGDCGRLRFPHWSDETEALARQCLDEALFLAGIADRSPGGIQG